MQDYNMDMQFLGGQQEEEEYMKWGGDEDLESFLEHIYIGSSSLLCYQVEWNLKSSRGMFVDTGEFEFKLE